MSDIKKLFRLKKSYQAEILDGRDYSKEELFKNLKELFFVNRWLGGHDGSIRLMKDCLNSGFRPDAVLDVGCGGGDALEKLERTFSGRLPDTSWTGCDLHPWCLDYASENHRGINLKYMESDFRAFPVSGKVLCHAALFFHHFREEEIIQFISFLQAKGAALIINDLRRHPMAWMGIRILAYLPFFGRLFRNDAPLSVERGFTRKEWQYILQQSGVRNYRIRNAWAFRHLILILPSDNGKV